MAEKSIREIRIEGNVAFITLTKGYEAVIDAVDVPLVDGFNWKSFVKKHTVYAVRTERIGHGKRRTVLLHRVIMGDPAGLQVDHRDGDGLNDRRFNLRNATRSQNLQNQRTGDNNTSGFKGVSWCKRDGKWRAHIRLDGKHHSLGYHDTPEAAHAAYCEASAFLHPDFGRTA